MEIITIPQNILEIIPSYAEKQTLGGKSNLSPEKLSKVPRKEFQITGLLGEFAWYIYRYNSTDKLINLLNYKHENCFKTKSGDGGFDDSITYNNKTRFVDIKTSHLDILPNNFSINNLDKYNLIVSPAEFHKNMIYVSAFSLGQSRALANTVVLAGWSFNEEIKEIWPIDSKSFRVKVPNLKSINLIKKYF